MLDQILNERYQIIAILGSGGFGRTYLAQDAHNVDNILCTVKQIPMGNDDLQEMKIAQNTFVREAEILKQLGGHPQIPQVLSYFEAFNNFFLVQEYVEGHPLSKEIVVGDRWNESTVIQFLLTFLPLLDFIHTRGVIHCDIKPDNILRRQQDNQLILVDFGNIKQVYQPRGSKVAIGTPGYMASEQFQGKYYFCSDLYSVGILVIQALTGFHPQFFQYDSQSGEILWQKNLCSPALAAVLSRMVSYRFQDRYQSAREVIRTLEQLQIPRSHTKLPPITSVSSYPLPPVNPPQFSNNGNALETPPRQRLVKKPKIRKTQAKPPKVFFLFLGLPVILIFSISFGITVFVQKSFRSPIVTQQPTPQQTPNPIEPTPTPDVPENSCTVTIANGLNIRSRPNGDKVGGMVDGERAILTGLEDGNWVEISNPIQGWVFKQYLQCVPVSFIEREPSPTPRMDAGQIMLETAFDTMEAGNLSDAIAQAQTVQPNSPAYRDAQAAILEWRRIQERYQAMGQAKRRRRWEDILKDIEINGLPESPYWREKFMELEKQAKSRI